MVSSEIIQIVMQTLQWTEMSSYISQMVLEFKERN